MTSCQQKPTEKADHHMSQATTHTRSIQMQTMYEDLARAQYRERLQQARSERRAYQLLRAQRLARRAEKAAHRARLHLARAI